MAYCTNTDISSEFKDITFSATTAVTDTEVDDFIDQMSSLIDSFISNRYETPVTGPISLLILKFICILLVKSRILSILSVKTPQDKTKQDPDGPTLWDRALKMLEQLKKGQLILPDADGPGSFEGGMSSFLMNEDIDYTFTMEDKNW